MAETALNRVSPDERTAGTGRNSTLTTRPGRGFPGVDRAGAPGRRRPWCGGVERRAAQGSAGSISRTGRALLPGRPGRAAAAFAHRSRGCARLASTRSQSSGSIFSFTQPAAAADVAAIAGGDRRLLSEFLTRGCGLLGIRCHKITRPEKRLPKGARNVERWQV